MCEGSCTIKQYTPMKPVKWVFKVRVRADAVNGYFCNCNVYVGQPGDGTPVETDLSGGVSGEAAD